MASGAQQTAGLDPVEHELHRQGGQQDADHARHHRQTGQAQEALDGNGDEQGKPAERQDHHDGRQDQPKFEIGPGAGYMFPSIPLEPSASLDVVLERNLNYSTISVR